MTATSAEQDLPATERVPTVWYLLGLLRLARPGALAGYSLLALVQVVVPVLSAYVVGDLVAGLRSGRSADVPTGPLVVLGALMLAAHGAAVLDGPVRDHVVRQVDGRLRGRLRELATTAATPVELAEPAVHADFGLAVNGYSHHTAGAAAVAQLALVFRVLAAVAVAAALALFSWWAALLALTMVLGHNALLRRQWAGKTGIRTLAVRLRPLQRRADHIAETATGASAAMEVRVFGLAAWLATQHERAALARLAPLWRKRGRILREQWAVVAMSVLAAAPVLALVAAAAARGDIGPAALFVNVRLIVLLLATAKLGMEPFVIDFGRVSAAAYARLVERFTRPLPEPVAAAPTGPPLIRLEGVTFSYPGTDRPVFDGLDLEIRPGERLAVVGLNGAGKSTLVRMLAGLVAPTSGRVTVDGIPLPEIPSRQWWARLGVVFQRPTRYPLTVADNVRFGAADHDAPDAIVNALAKADAAELVAGLPRGADTVVSTGFRGGTQLSGGQWQKVAFARAWYAAEVGAGVLVLDEPTAHLDVEAELAVFTELMAEAGQRTLVLVSHRFATVRHADRIVVLSEGRVAEEGSHAELLARAGQYAHWYHLQADLVRGAAVEVLR